MFVAIGLPASLPRQRSGSRGSSGEGNAIMFVKNMDLILSYLINSEEGIAECLWFRY